MKGQIAWLLGLNACVVVASDGDDDKDESTKDILFGDTGQDDTGDVTVVEPPDDRTIQEKLVDAGFAVTPAGTNDEGAELYELLLEQPDDHADPSGGTHTHYLTLIHRGFDRPVNMISTGYQNYLGFSEDSLTYALEANQVVLDKRFHNGQGSDWSLFTREQVAADAHRVRELLREIYPEPWISSGFSNGGVDVVNFRSRYPDDVVGTVAMGSPFMEPADQRFLAFFDAVDQDCQGKLEAVQFAVLGERRLAVEELVTGYATGYGDTFDRVASRSAYEAAALSYPWLFWQFWGAPEDCDALPDPALVTDEELALEFYSKVGIFGAFPMSDLYLTFFAAYFYEVQQDSGWPALPREDLLAAGLISPDLVDMEVGLVAPGVVPPPFDIAANDLLVDFALHGHDVIFTYSTTDPWATGAVDLSLGTGSNAVYWNTAGNHASDIYDLSEADRDAVFTQLQVWTGVTPR